LFVLRILIAEDDLVSRRFLSKFFVKYGECDTVVDGLETIDAFMLSLRDKNPYDLLLLDIIRDLEEQRGLLPKDRIKIIMVTALGEAELVKKAFEYGCEAYASKPIDTIKLVEVIKKLGLIDSINSTE
jgi:two-component system chemotaxis response regulator CheY